MYRDCLRGRLRPRRDLQVLLGGRQRCRIRRRHADTAQQVPADRGRDRDQGPPTPPSCTPAMPPCHGDAIDVADIMNDLADADVQDALSPNGSAPDAGAAVVPLFGQSTNGELSLGNFELLRGGGAASSAGLRSASTAPRLSPRPARRSRPASPSWSPFAQAEQTAARRPELRGSAFLVIPTPTLMARSAAGGEPRSRGPNTDVGECAANVCRSASCSSGSPRARAAGGTTPSGAGGVSGAAAGGAGRRGSA